MNQLIRLWTERWFLCSANRKYLYKGNASTAGIHPFRLFQSLLFISAQIFDDFYTSVRCLQVILASVDVCTSFMNLSVCRYKEPQRTSLWVFNYNYWPCPPCEESFLLRLFVQEGTDVCIFPQPPGDWDTDIIRSYGGDLVCVFCISARPVSKQSPGRPGRHLDDRKNLNN